MASPDAMVCEAAAAQEIPACVPAQRELASDDPSSSMTRLVVAQTCEGFAQFLPAGGILVRDLSGSLEFRELQLLELWFGGLKFRGGRRNGAPQRRKRIKGVISRRFVIPETYYSRARRSLFR